MTNLSISTKVRRDKNPINRLQSFLIWAALKGMFITNLGTCNDGTSMDSWTEYKVLHSPCCSQNHYSIFSKHLWDVWDCFLALKCFLNFVDKKTKLKKRQELQCHFQNHRRGQYYKEIFIPLTTLHSSGLCPLNHTLSHCIYS